MNKFIAWPSGGINRICRLRVRIVSESVVAIVRAPLGNGAGVFAPNIKLGLFLAAAARISKSTHSAT